jgi:hypothetical protein
MCQIPRLRPDLKFKQRWHSPLTATPPVDDGEAQVETTALSALGALGGGPPMGASSGGPLLDGSGGGPLIRTLSATQSSSPSIVSQAPFSVSPSKRVNEHGASSDFPEHAAAN